MNLTKLIQQDIVLPPVIGITPEAEREREVLLLNSSQYTVATNPTEANSLAEAARDLQTQIRAVEEFCLKERRPINALLSRMSDLAHEYLQPLVDEKDRCQRLATDYAKAERRRVEAEETSRRVEIQALEQLRVEAENVARKVASMVSDENSLTVAIEAEKNAQAVTALMQEAIRAPLPEVHKPVGMQTRREMAWEVTDIMALVKARPELCKIEAKASAIRAACGPKYPPWDDQVDTTTVPGLRLFWCDVTSTRKW